MPEKGSSSFVVSGFRKFSSTVTGGKVEYIKTGRKYTDICEVESVLKLFSDIFLSFLGRRKKYYQLRQMMGEEVWEV